MKKKVIPIFIVMLWMGFLPLFPENGVSGQRTKLDELIREALENNPKLAAAEQRVLSADKVIPQAGALPDPQLTFGLMNLPVDSFSFGQEPMTGKQIAIMQMFPFPGKLSLATDIAEFEAAAVKYQQAEVRNQIIQMVKKGYYDLYAVDRAYETTEKNKDLMEQFVHVTETKYATGSGLQQDVLRAQVELSKLEDDLIMWEQKRRAVVARLNAVLNRPVQEPMEETSQELSLPEKMQLLSEPKKIAEQRPILKAWRERIQKSESAVNLAKRDLWPNITIGASYSQRDNLRDGRIMPDFFSATVSLNVPLYANRKQKAKIAEKELDLKAVSAEYAGIRAEILSEVESILAELERNRKRVELYKDGILLQAEQSLESAQAGYSVGKVDFLTLVSNWMMLQNYELQYYFSLSDFYKNLANYVYAVGANSSMEN
ncbi:MAG: TolC family protein [Candidatus Aminicenantes bacterium]|nr:TolC family protein [Candidatus Aminicenantes bacterium]